MDERYSLGGLDSLKVRVYRIGLLTGITILVALLWQTRYTGPLNPEEGVLFPMALLFCTMSLGLLQRYQTRFLPWFERLVYGLIFAYDMGHYWAGLYEAWRGRQMIDFDRFLIWLPVIYAVAFMYFSTRRAIQVSALFLAGVAIPAAGYLWLSGGQPYYREDFAMLVSLVASGVVYVTLFYTLAVLRERYTQALSLAHVLQWQAETDHLTQIHSRAKIFSLFEGYVQMAKSSGKPFSIILADMDGLKHINDTYGHLAGDKALQQMATAIRNAIRRNDAVGRIGGDEFLVLCPGADAHAAARLCIRIEQAIARQPGEYGPLSASCDYATWEPGDTTTTLFRRADEGMYRCKRQRKAGQGV